MPAMRAPASSGSRYLLTVVAVAAAAAGLTSVISSHIRDTAIDSSMRTDAASLVAAGLPASELERPFAPARAVSVERRLASSLGDGVLRLTVVDPDGTILLSDRASLIGQNFGLETGMVGALRGVPDAALHIDAGSPTAPAASPALEEYLPVTFDGRTVAVVSVYRDAAPILAELGRIDGQLRAAVALSVAVFALMLATSWFIRSRPARVPAGAAPRGAIPAN